MRREEELLQKFMKENELTDLQFAWGTNVNRYYIANNSNNEEVTIHFNTDSEKITSRLS